MEIQTGFNWHRIGFSTVAVSFESSNFMKLENILITLYLIKLIAKNKIIVTKKTRKIMAVVL